LEKLKSEIRIASRKYPANPITKNSESYRLYLKGKYLLEKWTEDNLYKAIEYFKQSVYYDPLNVHSYVEMIECYFSLYFSDHISYSEVLIQIKPVLSIVSNLDQSIDVVQAMYGGKQMYIDWNFKEGKNHLQYALSLNPNCLIARHRYSDFLLLSGRFSEALKELQLITLIDPLSFPTYKRIGRLFYKLGRFESAINYLNDALELEPTDYVTLAILGATLTELGNYNEALSIFEKSLNSYFNIEIASMIGYIYALEGKKDKAQLIIEQIKSQPKEICQTEIKLARIYRALGEIEIAYEYLEQAFEQHNVDFVSLNSDPRWKSIANEPRFKKLVSKLGLSD
jgi:adenylate cyclase